MSAPVLFVHPYNHTQPDVIPAGSISAINLLPGPVAGRFAQELGRRDIMAARVILIDVQWFLPLAVLEGMLDAIRGINPDVRIVAGGITAAFFQKDFIDRFPVDYLVTGDVEQALPGLVERLVRGETPPSMPGVWDGGREPRPPARLTQEQFDALDWLTIDWFPSLRRRVEAVHGTNGGRPGASAGLYFPALPMTRGCFRNCAGCYGDYYGRVFGKGVLTRSPDALTRDLARIAADSSLSFVNLFFSDGKYLDEYAPVLEDAAFDLDANVFFCGAVDRGRIDAVRSGFKGEVVFSVIRPDDLRRVRDDPPAGRVRESFSRMLRHFDALKNTRARIFFINAEPHEDAGAAGRHEGSVDLVNARDWLIKRPTVKALEESGSAGRLLEELIAAARACACAHFLRSLVLPMREGALKGPLELPTLLTRLDEGISDPFEEKIVNVLIGQVLGHGIYGFDDLRLRWTGRSVREGFGAGWMAAGEDMQGQCAWGAGLNGFSWKGELEIGGKQAHPMALAPLPTLVIHGRPPMDVGAWTRNLVPALEVGAGPRRAIQLGGEAGRDTMRLWLLDREMRREWVLDYSALTSIDEGDKPPDATGESFFENIAAAPWPDPSWPEALLAWIGEGGTQKIGGWRVQGSIVRENRLELRLRAGDGYTMLLAVFPREGSGKYICTQRFSIAYMSKDRERFESSLYAPLVEILMAAEGSL